jgi:hypothetical protein
MSEPKDPVRLLDDPGTSAELRSLLVTARGDVIDRAAVARVQARVHDRLATPTSTRRWWGIGTGAAVVVGWLALRSLETPGELAVATIAVPVMHVEDDSPEPAVPARVASTAHDIDPDVATPPDRAIAATRAREPRRPSRPAPVAASTPAPAESASEEARLLLAARRALARDPASALARTAEHERRFADGTLVEEREVVAVRALVALDRRADAKTRADRFAARFPDSVHRSALARALE